MKRYNIKNILVPIDFSPLSLFALQHAERIGKLTRSHITLLNVVENIADSMGVDGGSLAAAMSVERDIQEQNTTSLSRLAKASARRTQLKVDARVRIGRPSETITRVATTLKSNLIVMGTHGASGFVGRLLGSTTYRVATLSDIPVLSVHKAPPTRGFSNIIYPVRAGTGAAAKFPFALAFANLFDARVHVVGQMMSDSRQGSAHVAQLCSRIERRFKEHELITKRSLSSQEQFAEAVIHYAGALPGPLVVIVHERDFRLVEVFKESFAKKILHKKLSPILTIPA